VNDENILLRGMFLRYTPYVVGVAVYTGKETKMFMNSAKSVYKVSHIMK